MPLIRALTDCKPRSSTVSKKAPTVSKTGGPGTEPDPETGSVGTVFPETESGTGTAGTVFQEPEPEPSLPVKLY